MTAAAIVSPGAFAADVCEYQSFPESLHTNAFGVEQGEERPYVRVVASTLNVRKSGPRSAVIGSASPDDGWINVQGICGKWLEIRRGFGTGWIYGPFTCQGSTNRYRKNNVTTWNLGAVAHCGTQSNEELLAASRRREKGIPPRRVHYVVLRDRAIAWLKPSSEFVRYSADQGRKFARISKGTVLVAVYGGGSDGDGFYQVEWSAGHQGFTLTEHAIDAGLEVLALEEGVYVSAAAVLEQKTPAD